MVAHMVQSPFTNLGDLPGASSKRTWISWISSSSQGKKNEKKHLANHSKPALSNDVLMIFQVNDHLNMWVCLKNYGENWEKTQTPMVCVGLSLSQLPILGIAHVHPAARPPNSWPRLALQELQETSDAVLALSDPLSNLRHRAVGSLWRWSIESQSWDQTNMFCSVVRGNQTSNFTPTSNIKLI